MINLAQLVSLSVALPAELVFVVIARIVDTIVVGVVILVDALDVMSCGQQMSSDT